MNYNYIKYGFIISSLIAILEAYFLFLSPIESSNISEIDKQKGRIEVLESQKKSLTVNAIKLEGKIKKLDSILSEKPKEIVINKIRYENEISNVNNISIDSSISFVSRKLSKININ